MKRIFVGLMLATPISLFASDHLYREQNDTNFMCLSYRYMISQEDATALENKIKSSCETKAAAELLIRYTPEQITNCKQEALCSIELTDRENKYYRQCIHRHMENSKAYWPNGCGEWIRVIERDLGNREKK